VCVCVYRTCAVSGAPNKKKYFFFFLEICEFLFIVIAYI